MGLAAAQELRALGAELLLVGRSADRLNRAARTVGPGVETAVADATDDDALSRLFGATSRITDIVMAISNNAQGGSIPATPTEDAKGAFARLWASYSTLHLAAQVLPRSGSVTLISGSSARTPLAGYGVWTTLHGAIEALSLAASIDLAPIRVNTVSPGGIDLKPDRQLVERPGTASDIGLAVALVVSNPAMTGSVIDVDSGERRGTWSG